MSIVIMVGQLLLGLSILVILHELGHFLAARAFGIKVEKFYLFFDAWNFSLVKFTYKGVQYGIGWLPLGGYVKIAGMIDESMDTEQLAGEPQPWEFRSKPAWQRLIVMMGGIIVNIFLGIFIFWMLTLKYGETYIPTDNVKYGIVPGKIGMQIGLKTGDQITAINGQKIERFDDLISTKVLFGNATLTVLRNGEEIKVAVPGNLVNSLSDRNPGQFISPRMLPIVDSVNPGSYAAAAGLKKGDQIAAVNGTPVQFFDELQLELQKHKSQKVDLTINRNNLPVTASVQVNKFGILGMAEGGFGFAPKEPETQNIAYGLSGSLPVGASKAWDLFIVNAKGIGKMAKGEVKIQKAVAGPIAMATMFGDKIDWPRFWSLVGLLSMALAFMNLLPIPALDGGHALFLIIEMIKGKPLSDKFLERAQMVGFVVLISLMVFVFGNDITKLIKK